MKIKFLKSPTGKFKLAYNAGDVAEVDNKLAAQCVEAGYAEEVKQASKKFNKKRS